MLRQRLNATRTETQRDRKRLAKESHRLEFALLHHRNTRGQPLHFVARPYLWAIYRDRARERVFKKAVQCGVSELLIVDALAAASRGLQCLYVMPTQEKRDAFVANRVSRVIRATPFYRGLVRSGSGCANSAGLKHFGKGVIRFVGSNVESEFIEFPADLVIVDEVDRCSQENLPLVRDRLAASEHKLAAWASTPTLVGAGIAKLFDATDAKEWFVRCDACGERQPLDFFKNVVRQTADDEYELLDREWVEKNACLSGQTCPTSPTRPTSPGERRSPDLRVFCIRCGQPIDRLAQGEWVARHPDCGVSGYHISQLFVPTCSVRELWDDWQAALQNDFERQRFYNSLLGEPYTAEGSGLSRADILACCGDYAMPHRAAGATMGVDVGEWFHVRISDHPEPGVRRAVFIGRVREVGELDLLLARYDVRCCVVDAQPEAHLVREWQKRHPPGRIWRCVYTDDDVRELRKDHREGIVRAARTPSLDAATEDILSRRNALPRNAATLDGGDFVAQMTAPVRTLVTGPQGAQRYVWTKPAADHYRHADNYDALATRLRAGKGAGGAAGILVAEPRLTALPAQRIFRAA